MNSDIVFVIGILGLIVFSVISHARIKRLEREIWILKFMNRKRGENKQAMFEGEKYE